MSDNAIFSYTKRDYEGSRKEGLAKIPSISKGIWTDLNATDPGVIILDYVHALVDMMNYYQDHQALETFITTAKERANIFRLAKQLSYNVRSAKGSTCTVTFETPVLYDYSVKIPKWTRVSTATDTFFYTTADAYLPPKKSSIDIVCSQGIRKTIQYKGTGISRFSNIADAENQSIRIVDSNIDIDTVEIVDTTGRTWTPVDYIVFSTDIDRVYEVDLNPDDSISIKFGDGERGILPQPTDTLTISYVSTKASEGRVEANSIISLDDRIYDDNNEALIFYVHNNQASTGGSKSQSSREIRDTAPGVIKSQDRAVTLKDFENLARMVDGVAAAKAYDKNNRASLLYHEVKVLVIPSDLSEDSEVLTSRVYDYLSKRMIPPTNLQVITPSRHPVDIAITARRLDNISASRLQYSIQRAVESYFNDRLEDIEESLYPADLSAIVSRVDGVRSVLSITPNSPVECPELSTITLGSLNITIE